MPDGSSKASTFATLSGPAPTPQTVTMIGSPGPSPPPSPWLIDGPTIFYDEGGVAMPRAVTGGTKGVGTINAEALFINGNPLATSQETVSISQGVGILLTPNPILSNGTIALANTVVTPASYGDAGHVAAFTVDQQGRLTAAGNTAISAVAIGALTGITAGAGISVSGTAPTPTVALTSPIAAGGPVGDAGHVPQMSWDVTGRLTVVTSVAITPAAIGAQPAGSYLPTTGGTMTGTLLWNAGAALTANTPALNVVQTWNNAAVGFEAIRVDITGTANAVPSFLARLRYAGLDKFYVDTFGNASVSGGVFALGSQFAQQGTAMPAGGIQDAGYLMSSVAHFGIIFGSGPPNKVMAQGSIYLRSDGQPQYNSDGTATGWLPMGGGGSVTISDTAPASPTVGALWWNSVLGQMFIWFNDGTSTQWVPASPSTIASPLVLRGFIDGFQHTVPGGTQAFTIGAGQAAAMDNSLMFAMAASLAKTMSPWVQGAGGALDTGTVAASTWYTTYAIYNPTTGATDILASLQPTNATPNGTPTLPAGFTKYHLIGALWTDGSSNLLGIIQIKDNFILKAQINHGQTASPLIVAVPPGRRLRALIVGYLQSPNTGVGGNMTYFDYGGVTQSYKLITANTPGSSTGMLTTIPFEVIVNNQQLSFVANGTLSAYQNYTVGWIDPRGTDL
jgi:hypothetical protein